MSTVLIVLIAFFAVVFVLTLLISVVSRHNRTQPIAAERRRESGD